MNLVWLKKANALYLTICHFVNTVKNLLQTFFWKTGTSVLFFKLIKIRSCNYVLAKEIC